VFALKPISHESVTGALAKAERYRLLNEPGEAESICCDILEIEPRNQPALISLLLALTDQISHESRAFANAMAIVDRVESPYDRAYYTGIAWERRGNDDAVLRWNACVRYLGLHRELAPAAEETPEPILTE